MYSNIYILLLLWFFCSPLGSNLHMSPHFLNNNHNMYILLIYQELYIQLLFDIFVCLLQYCLGFLLSLRWHHHHLNQYTHLHYINNHFVFFDILIYYVFIIYAIYYSIYVIWHNKHVINLPLPIL